MSFPSWYQNTYCGGSRLCNQENLFKADPPGSTKAFVIQLYIFDDADEGDGVPGLRVVLVAAQDEGGRHQHVQVEVVKLHACLGRHLQETENVEIQTDTFG